MDLCHRCSRGYRLIFLRSICTHQVLESNHYKTLGLNPSATNAEIKSAYYELSKKHHPDRNKGSEKSAETFRKVTAAYEVLGNEKSRKEYDIEQQFQTKTKTKESRFESPLYDNDTIHSEFDRMMTGRRPAGRFYGKTEHYDYGAWYRAHYGHNSNDFKAKSEPSRYNYKFTRDDFKYDIRKNYRYDTRSSERFRLSAKAKRFFVLYLLIGLSVISVTCTKKKV